MTRSWAIMCYQDQSVAVQSGILAINHQDPNVMLTNLIKVPII